MLHSIKIRKWIGLLAYPFFMLCLLSPALPQSSAFELITNFKFEEATTQLQKNPSDNPYRDIYLANLADIASLMLDESEGKFEQVKSAFEKRLERSEALPTNEWKNFITAEMKLQWAFVALKNGHDWDAFWSLRSAYKLNKNNIKDYPNFYLNKRTSAIFDILLGSVPSNKQWVFNLFGLEGNVMSGISTLENFNTSEPVFQYETQLIKDLISVYLLEEEAIAPLPFQPNADLSLFVQALIYLKTHMALSARSNLMEVKANLPVKAYFLAETYFLEESYEKAKVHYHGFLEQTKGNSYQKDTYLKLGLCELFLNNEAASEKYLSKAREIETANTEVDKNARKMLDNLTYQHLTLLRLRYALDGGFYEKAKAITGALNKEPLTPKEKVELNYRQARLNQLTNNFNKAADFYHMVIENAALIEESYYAPNAYLQMGRMMEVQGKMASAKMYYEQVLAYKKHPYKESLDAKAKIALSRLTTQ